MEFSNKYNKDFWLINIYYAIICDIGDKMAKNKNKIHNPQIVSGPIPAAITVHDIGRIWVDSNNKKLVNYIKNLHEINVEVALLIIYNEEVSHV